MYPDQDEMMGTAQANVSWVEPGTTTSASEEPGKPSPQELRRILGLTVPLVVTIAERDMAIESVLAIKVGTIIEFDVAFDSELTLHVANRPIAKGHAVKIGENFGLRVTRIHKIEDRIEALGGGSGFARLNQTADQM